MIHVKQLWSNICFYEKRIVLAKTIAIIDSSCFNIRLRKIKSLLGRRVKPSGELAFTRRLSPV